MNSIHNDFGDDLDVMYNVNKNLIHIENPKHLERKGFYTLTTIHNLDHGIRESKTLNLHGLCLQQRGDQKRYLCMHLTGAAKAASISVTKVSHRLRFP
jgi:hypothetical protein